MDGEPFPGETRTASDGTEVVVMELYPGTVAYYAIEELQEVREAVETFVERFAAQTWE